MVKPNGSGIVAFDKKTGAVKYQLADELLKDDTRAFAGMRFQEGAFVGADRHLRKWFAWVHDFPKHDAAAVLAAEREVELLAAFAPG